MIIQREHMEGAIKGIARQVGRSVPDLDNLSYKQLVIRYCASLQFYDVIQFTEDEIEELLKGEIMHVR